MGNRKKLSLIILVFVVPLLSAACDEGKNPYLIYTGSNTAMKIMWQMTETKTCTLEWGIKDGNYTMGNVNTVESGGGLHGHVHSHMITGLQAGTRYYYRVSSGSIVRTGSFFTAPADSVSHIRFLAFGDTRSATITHDQVCAGVIANFTDDPATTYQTIAIGVGDMTFDGNIEGNWNREFFNKKLPNAQKFLASVPFTPPMGNHENLGLLYKKYFPFPFAGGRYWSYDYGPLHVVLVDQYASYAPGSAQYRWLEHDLASSMKPWKIIALHEPGWSCASSSLLQGHPNNTGVQNYIQPLCKKYGVPLVIAGHNHYYARALVDGVTHLTTGGGGAPLYAPRIGEPNIVAAAETFHYCRFEIIDDMLSCDVVRPDGSIVDSFHISLR